MVPYVDMYKLRFQLHYSEHLLRFKCFGNIIFHHERLLSIPLLMLSNPSINLRDITRQVLALRFKKASTQG